MDHDSEIKNFYFRMSGSRRASIISSMGADEIAELFEKLFDNLNQFKFTEAREFISKSAKKLPRKVFIRYCMRHNSCRIVDTPENGRFSIEIYSAFELSVELQ